MTHLFTIIRCEWEGPLLSRDFPPRPHPTLTRTYSKDKTAIYARNEDLERHDFIALFQKESPHIPHDALVTFRKSLLEIETEETDSESGFGIRDLVDLRGCIPRRCSRQKIRREQQGTASMPSLFASTPYGGATGGFNGIEIIAFFYFLFFCCHHIRRLIKLFPRCARPLTPTYVMNINGQQVG